MQLKYIILFTVVLCVSLNISMSGQNKVCGPEAVIDSNGFSGTAFSNYGSHARVKNQKYRTSVAIGQTFVGYQENAGYTSTLGFYSRFLLAPFQLKVIATQGDLLDRIQLTWEIDALGPSPNSGFNIYRDGVFLATVGPNIRNYNDFNVIAGKPYVYSVRGLNAYGEGTSSLALGFQIPNGVVTGWVHSVNGSPVPDALVTLLPMQGFSAKFGSLDGATSIGDSLNPFLPKNGGDWTIAFWMKTVGATMYSSVINLNPSKLFIRALNSSLGHEGVEVATSKSGAPFLSALFTDSTKNGWHHVALSYDKIGTLGRLYIDGVLMSQSPMDKISDIETLGLGSVGANDGWKGRIDELRIYHKLLNELDFGEVMEGTASSQTPSLSHYWKMDEELGEKSYDIIKRHKLYFCGAKFDKDRPPVRTGGKTNSDGYYRIESASYGTGTTFLAEPAKSFYLHRSLKLNKTDQDYISLPDFSLTNKSTIELWVNNASSGGTQCLLSKIWGDNEFRLFLEPNDLNNEIKIYLNGTIQSFGNLGNGFQHIAVTIDSLSGMVHTYHNGILAGSFTITGVHGNWSDPNQRWLLGVRNNGFEYFNGLIDELAVYDSTLSVTTILDHFKKSRNIQEKGLRVYFPFDEGNGNRLSNVGSVFLDYGSLVGAEWSAFAPNQMTQPHKFIPVTRQVTLNPSVTSVDQVDFTDRSTVAVSGIVRYKNTDCFAKNVEILVNGSSFSPKIFTDSTGKFVIDFDPGTTARLTPKYADQTFVPAFWDLTNVSSPIIGILFNDITTRKIQGKVAGGFCKKSIIQAPPDQGQGTVCVVKVRTIDGCFERIVTIDNQEGDFEFENLPPIEKLTVAVVEHSDPLIKTAFQVKGGSTVDLSKKDTSIDFIYFAQPEVEIVSGLEPYSEFCDVIVMDQYDKKEIVIRLKEQYVATDDDDGVCYIDSASFRIINGFGDEIKDTTMGKGKLVYKFKVGTPNPTPPFLKTIQFISTTLAGNDGELTKQGVVTGVRTKQNTFTTTLPETPTMVLRDPPGDGSYSFIEKNEKFCQKLSFKTESATGPDLKVLVDAGPDINLFPFFGVPLITIETELGSGITSNTRITKATENSMEVCTSLNQRLATSEDDLIVGGVQGGDVFVGGGLNIEFGFADVVDFDANTCMATDSLAVIVAPGNYATTFMYSEWAIRNNVLVYLNNLFAGATDTTEKANYLNSINRWNKILANNEVQKEKAKFIKNISFDAGVTYEYSATSDTSSTLGSSNGQTEEFSFDMSAKAKLAGIGAGFELRVVSETTTGKTEDGSRESGITTGYVLKDNDVLDAFSIDVAMDSVYKTPVFRIKSGQSSCPWEPGTAKREGVLLTSVDGPTRTDVPAHEPAVFHFILGNTSATNETWTYAFTAGPESNPNGAKIFCNGAPMNQIQWYAIPFGTSLPVTVTVERGPVEYDYDDLEIVLYSACEDQRANDLGILPDTAQNLYSAVYVSAHFIRPCSEVNINVPEQDWVLFPDPLTPGPDDIRRITVSGYDTAATDFQLIRVQYRRSDGDGAWINIPGISDRYNGNWSGYNDLSDPKPPKLQKNFTQFFWDTEGLSDGPYEIRAVSVCSGDASDKPGYSQIIKGRIDRQPPSLVGTPQPSDGVFNVGDEISFTFNQDINCNKLIGADILNANNIALYDATTNKLINIHFSCVGNKIVIDPLFQNKFFENRILRAELHNIQDLTGNVLTEAHWEFYVDRNELAWLTDSIELTKYIDESKSIIAKIHNRGGYPVPFKIESVLDWVHVSPDRGTLVANEIAEVHFTVDSLVPLGGFSDSIVLHTEAGQNPFFMGGDEVLNLSARVICRPPQWVPLPGNFDPSAFSFSMSYIVQLNIDDKLSTDIQDIVGAYVDGQLRGISKLQYNKALNKYISFLTVYSNVSSGEKVEFQIWDASACHLYASTVESFLFEENEIIGSLLTPQVLHTDGKLLSKIYIHPGWNWFSMNLNLLDASVNGALKSLSNPAGALIKGQLNFSAYSASKEWFGSLDSISPYSFYQMKDPVYDSILMIGGPIEVSSSIPVKSGWNWIGFLPQSTLPIGEALASLSPQDGDLIKGQLAFAQYVTGLGWIGNLNFLSPPNGYLLKLSNAGTLKYPNPDNYESKNHSRRYQVVEDITRTTIDITKPEAMPFNYWQVDPTKYEYSMNAIAIVIKKPGDNNMLREGDEVSAFVGNEIRGSSKAIYIPTLNAFMIFMTIYANADGESLKFRFYNALENKEYDLLEKTGFKVNSFWGEVDKPQPLHLFLSTAIGDVKTSPGYLSIYPNPFSTNFTIKINSDMTEEVQIDLKDVNGKTVDHKTAKIRTGINLIEWNNKLNLTDGIYFISTRGSKEGYRQKLIYLR